MLGCNRRYLAHLAALDDFSAGVRALDRLTKPRTVEQKTLKGINFFDPVDKQTHNTFVRPDSGKCLSLHRGQVARMVRDNDDLPRPDRSFGLFL
jgi:hypothetical protein